MTAVYASNCHIQRSLWNSISQIQSQHAIPWCCIGDFNVILGTHEHKGKFSPAIALMHEFHQWSESNNFIHLHTRGAQFTWSNGRKGRFNTQKRLDRAIVNHDWINACSSITVSTLTKLKSDHFPLILNFKNQNFQFSSSFKFMKMWNEHPDCENVIKQVWKSSVVGCLMFILSQKLKMLKDKLKVWNKDVFGDVHSQVSNAYKIVDEIQEKIDAQGHSDSLMEQENKMLRLTWKMH